MATIVLPRPLTDNQEVAALLRTLVQHQQQQSYGDLTALLQTVSALEDQLRVTTVELEKVKRELRTVQQSVPSAQRYTAARLVKTAETALRQVGEQLRNIRGKIIQTAKVTLENVTQSGISGLNGLTELIGIRKALHGLETQMGSAAATLETGIARMEAAGKELHRAGAHLRNIGRALTGKEPLAAETEKRVAALAPLRGLAGAFRGMEERAGRALDALEKLERAAEVKKPSVRETLKALEAKQTAEAPATAVLQKEAAL